MLRINRYIASTGLCSRREADRFVESGRVVVNGKVADIWTQVDEGDSVLVDGNPVNRERHIYLMLNKPKGYLTALKDDRAATIRDLISDIEERVFPLGRLDLNSEGLLILTNDGDLFNSLMHPRAKVWKRYQVELDRRLLKPDMVKIREGLYIKKFDYHTLPAKIDIVSGYLYISIREGKKRQIRRVFSTLGYRVNKLKRVAVGSIELGNLELGRYRYLTAKEISYLKGL